MQTFSDEWLTRYLQFNWFCVWQCVQSFCLLTKDAFSSLFLTTDPCTPSSSPPHDFIVTFYWPFELIVVGYFNRMFPNCLRKWKQLNLPSTPFYSVFSLMRDRRQAGSGEMLILFKSHSRHKKKKIRGWQWCCACMPRCEQTICTWGLCSKNAIFNLHCRMVIKTPTACLVSFNNIFRRRMQY